MQKDETEGGTDTLRQPELVLIENKTLFQCSALRSVAVFSKCFINEIVWA